MEKKSKIDPLRRIIREEVINALRKELPILLAEQFERQRVINESTELKPKKNIKESLSKQLASSFSPPLTLNNSVPKPVVPNIGLNKNNPLQNLLQETAMSMTDQDDFAFSTDDVGANPINLMQPTNVKVGDIRDTLSTAIPSSDISMVQINTVPDYNDLMNKMLQNRTM
jgi:hypothetical protein